MKKILFFSIAILCFSQFATAQNNNIGIGTSTPDPAAVLEVHSNNQGLLPPRLTNIERDNIVTPVPAGLLIWCSNCGTSGELQVFNGSIWTNMVGDTAALAIPTLTTATISAILGNSATSGGTIINDGGGSITVSGICWSTSPNPTIANDKTTDGTASGSFASNMTGLLSGTTYYVRAYATNSTNTGYGNEISFTTLPAVLATVTTTVVTGITASGASGGGNVTNDGFDPNVIRGVCWDTIANPTVSNDTTEDGLGAGSFTSNLTGLLPGTTYYYRAYASNSAGTSYGTEYSFNTPVAITLATVTTTPATSITSTTAFMAGDITSNGNDPNPPTGGVCWNIAPNPVIYQGAPGGSVGTYNGTGPYGYSITGLPAGTTIYYRAWALNAAGVSYGAELTFITPLAIGDSYGGGIVFYIASPPADLNGDGNPDLGLVAAPTDQSTGIAWCNCGGPDISCSGGPTTIVAGNVLTNAGGADGQTNTNTIISAQGDGGNHAALLCDCLTLNGYSDWFLPNYTELNFMYNNIGPGNALGLGNIGGFALDRYWTSEETVIDRADTYRMDFGTSQDRPKGELRYVRAIRAF